MLNKNTTEVAANLGEIFREANVKLVPKQASLISNLVIAVDEKANTINMLSDDPALILQLGSEGSMSEIAGQKHYTPSTHDSYLDNYVPDLTKLVAGHISFARATVKPEIVALKENIEKALGSYKCKPAESFFNVRYYRVPQVLTSGVIAAAIKSCSDHKGGYIASAEISLTSLEQGDWEQVVTEYMLTGDPSEDKLIYDWLNSSEEPLERLILTPNKEMWGYDKLDKLNIMLAKFLFYRRLSLGKEFECGLTSVELRNRAKTMMRYTGQELNALVNVLELETKEGRIILNTIHNSFSIYNKDNIIDLYILEPSFDKLVEGGGDITTVFGYVAQSRERQKDGSNTAKAMIADKEALSSAWMTTRSIYTSHMNSNMDGVFKMLLHNLIEDNLKNPMDDSSYAEYLGKNPEYLGFVRKQSKEYIESLRSLEVQESSRLEEIALTLIAKIKYGYTDSYRILSDMRDQLLLDDQLDPMVAALHAALNYVVDFCLCQVDVVAC